MTNSCHSARERKKKKKKDESLFDSGPRKRVTNQSKRIHVNTSSELLRIG